MNWSKGKNIIIAVLLITNIILLYLYISNTVDFRKSEKKERFDKYLKSKQVFLKTEVPGENGEKPMLLVAYSEMKNENFFRAGRNHKSKINSISMAEKEADDIMIRMDYYTDYCVQEKTEKLKGKNNYDVKYKSVYKSIPIEESYAKIEIRNGEIKSLKRRWLEPIREGETKSKTINGVTAVLRFVEKQKSKKTDEKIYIEKIEEVYWLDEKIREIYEDIPLEDTAVPAWKITYNGGKVEYIEAYMGT